MTIRPLLLALSAVALGASGCDHLATEGDGPLTGTWRYSATGVNFAHYQPDGGHHCDFTTVYVMTQSGSQVEGRSPEGPMTCTGPGGQRWTDTFPAGVVRGEVQDGRLYITTAGNWHSFGQVQPDRVEGYLELYDGYADSPLVPHRTGTFVMERISGEGYHGPRA